MTAIINNKKLPMIEAAIALAPVVGGSLKYNTFGGSFGSFRNSISL